MIIRSHACAARFDGLSPNNPDLPRYLSSLLLIKSIAFHEEIIGHNFINKFMK